MAKKTWTEEQIERIKALRKTGKTVRQVAEILGCSGSAVSGILFRAGATKKCNKVIKRPGRQGPHARRLDAFEITPSKTPFAPDDTVPDFAWDDRHCDAVLGQGGYPAMTFRRVA
jgi:hypothetical protein